ncbi:MAG: hypothetical protein U1G07_13400 [Verrucomicrobiota bacterium]
MNANHCCQGRRRTVGEATPSRLRQGSAIAGWLVPSATLALLPKCPACLAAYVALFSGISLSVGTASYLRISIVILSVSVLLYLSLKRLRRLRFQA